MQTFTKIILAVIIVCMSITQFYQGKTISRLQEQMENQTKINKANNETFTAYNEAIVIMGEAVKITNKTIRAMYR